MPAEILVVQNESLEGLGLLGKIFDEEDIAHEIVDLDAGDPFPILQGYGGLVVLGGPDSANDASEKMRTELARIRDALAIGLPYLGICLGMQALVKAAGGSVRKNEVPEIGFYASNGDRFTVALTPEGRADPLLAGLPDPFPIAHLHGETVELAEGMTLLGTGKYCTHQIARIGSNAYGIQGHCELTDELVEAWLELEPSLRAREADVREAWEQTREESMHIGRRLLTNFLCIANVIPARYAGMPA